MSLSGSLHWRTSIPVRDRRNHKSLPEQDKTIKMNMHLRSVTAAAESALRIIFLNRYFCSSFRSLFRINQISSILSSVSVREAIVFPSRKFVQTFLKSEIHKKLCQHKMHFAVIIPSVVRSGFAQSQALFAQMVRSNVFCSLL